MHLIGSILPFYMTREIYLNREADYYFFIEENFEFGYLGHPWRQEIWIFGRDLIKEIEQVYLELGWKKLN